MAKNFPMDDISAFYLEPTQESGRAFVMRQLVGPIVMLNLLRFRGNPESAAAANRQAFGAVPRPALSPSDSSIMEARSALLNALNPGGGQ